MTTTPNIDRVLGSARHGDGIVYCTADVVARVWRGPDMVRLVLRAGGLAEMATSHPNAAVRLFVPAGPEPVPELALQSDLPAEIVELRHRARVYTARRWRPAVGEVDVDVVVHGGGIVSAWAAADPVGDRIYVGGARHHAVPAFDGRPLLLLGDDSALPAMAAIAEACPAGVPVTVIGEVSARGSEQAIDASTAEIEWCYRTEGDTLAAALDRRMASPAWDPGNVRVWVAGELGMTRLLRQAIQGAGVPPDSVQVFAYWRAGSTATQLDEGRAAAYAEAQARGQALSTVDDLDIR